MNPTGSWLNRVPAIHPGNTSIWTTMTFLMCYNRTACSHVILDFLIILRGFHMTAKARRTQKHVRHTPVGLLRLIVMCWCGRWSELLWLWRCLYSYPVTICRAIETCNAGVPRQLWSPSGWHVASVNLCAAARGPLPVFQVGWSNPFDIEPHNIL